MSRSFVMSIVFAMCAMAGPEFARAQAAPAADAATATATSGGSPEVEQAIAQQLARLQESFNAGQADGAVAVFLPTGELVDEAGVTHSGREQVAELFAGFFAKFPGAKMQLEVESVRPITPQLAAVDMVRAITTADGKERAVTRSNLTFAQQDGAWLIASSRDVPAEAELSPHQHLEPLGWLVGDWVDEGADSLIQIHCDWSKDENFLLVDYLIKREGQVELSSQQRIGWDPVYEQVRSWVFDADGGFGEALWNKVGETWVMKSSAVMPDGATGSATFIIEPQGKDRFVMRGLDRILGEDVREDVEMTIVKKPPQSSNK